LAKPANVPDGGQPGRKLENTYYAEIAAFLRDIGVPVPRLIRSDPMTCLILIEDGVYDVIDINTSVGNLTFRSSAETRRHAGLTSPAQVITASALQMLAISRLRELASSPIQMSSMARLSR
jgi:hypothetical protein